MDTRLDRLHGVDVSLKKMSALRVVAVLLALTAVVAFSARHPVPSAAANVGALAYCVTSEGASAGAGVNAALYTLDATGVHLYDEGTTDYNGCGVFHYVTADQSFYLVAWTESGSQAGNTDWFRTDAMTVAPDVELQYQGFYNRLALH